MKYRVVSGQTQTDLEILPGPGTLFTVVIDGISYVADVQHVDGGEIFTLLVDGRSYELVAQRQGQDTNIIIEGESYTARVYEGALARMAHLPTPSLESAEQKLTAAMPGVVVDALVSAGDEVTQGVVLVVIESMKMNNPIKAPRDGKVKSVNVKKGDRVNRGDVLVVLE